MRLASLILTAMAVTHFKEHNSTLFDQWAHEAGIIAAGCSSFGSLTDGSSLYRRQLHRVVDCMGNSNKLRPVFRLCFALVDSNRIRKYRCASFHYSANCICVLLNGSTPWKARELTYHVLEIACDVVAYSSLSPHVKLYPLLIRSCR